MNALKFVLIGLSVIAFSACSNLMGGADYKYSHTNLDGTGTKVIVHSTRETEGLTSVKIDANGTATITTGSITSGANNLGSALGIIDGLIKAGALAAVP